jgi:xanthosine utilization system XapX-like protein
MAERKKEVERTRRRREAPPSLSFFLVFYFGDKIVVRTTAVLSGRPRTVWWIRDSACDKIVCWPSGRAIIQGDPKSFEPIFYLIKNPFFN